MPTSKCILAHCCTLYCTHANSSGLYLFRETYQYYNLPFCQPADGKEYKKEFLGEVLEGDRLVTTPYALKFRTDVDNTVLCEKKLGSADLKKFREAVKQDYYFQVRSGRQLALFAARSCPVDMHQEMLGGIGICSDVSNQFLRADVL